MPISFRIALGLFLMSNGLVYAQLLNQQALQTYMQGEQDYSEGNALLTLPRNALGAISPSFTSYGTLEEKFRPSSKTRHALVVLNIPETEMGDLSFSKDRGSRAQDFLRINKDGKSYIRFFIFPTPANLKHYDRLIKKYPKDAETFYGEQQSAGRTLVIEDSQGNTLPFQIKASLNEKMGNHQRILYPEQTKRAVVVSDTLQMISEDSARTWSFMPETAGVNPPGGLGGFIVREFPSEFYSSDNIILPLFALINPKRNPAWIDEIARENGMTRFEYLEKVLVPELSKVYADICIEEGVLLSLHQQNTLVVFDSKSKKFKKVIVRDLDAAPIDTVSRASRKKPDLSYINEQSVITSADAIKRKEKYFSSFNNMFRLEGVGFLFGLLSSNFFQAKRLMAVADKIVFAKAEEVFGHKFVSPADFRDPYKERRGMFRAIGSLCKRALAQ